MRFFTNKQTSMSVLGCRMAPVPDFRLKREPDHITRFTQEITQLYADFVALDSRQT